MNDDSRPLNYLENLDQTTPSPEFELEKGRVLNSSKLESGIPIKIVEIKGVGHIFFRSQEDDRKISTGGISLRPELEKLAFDVNSTLGFDLVPTTVWREVDGEMGVAQKIQKDSVIAESLGEEWAKYISDENILKAGIFDFIIEAKDRHPGTFLVDKISRKVWLIDNDYLMFISGGVGESVILSEVKKRGLGDKIPMFKGPLLKLQKWLEDQVEIPDQTEAKILKSMLIRVRELLSGKQQ
jgi:hypothetical protein